jgi:hypothetical protein
MNANGVGERRFSIQLPTQTSVEGLHGLLTNLDKLLIDVILYLAYGIAAVSVFKIAINIINGFTSKPYMGP